MATIKKANTGKLIKGAINAVTSSKKVTIPSGLKKSIKKSQSGPIKITPYSSEAERIAAGGPTNLQKYKTVNRFDPDYQKPYKPKKQPKVDKYGFDTRPDRNGGAHKAKNGKSFPDLNKDGKVTRADILKGRGVIAKNGKPIKKAFLGALAPLAMKALPMLGGMLGGKGKEGGGGGIGGMLGGLLGGKNGKTVKKSKSGSTIKKTGMHKMPNGSMMKNSKMKMGGSMKKCKYGCK
jgi:hypothetical protein